MLLKTSLRDKGVNSLVFVGKLQKATKSGTLELGRYIFAMNYLEFFSTKLVEF